MAPFVGELAGGSVREWDTDLLQARLPHPPAALGSTTTSSNAKGSAEDPPAKGQQEEGLENKKKNFFILKISAELHWYAADLRRSGYPRSSGFGLGFERLVQTLLGVANVRDTTPFPRWYKHCRH